MYHPLSVIRQSIDESLEEEFQHFDQIHPRLWNRGIANEFRTLPTCALNLHQLPGANRTRGSATSRRTEDYLGGLYNYITYLWSIIFHVVPTVVVVFKQ